jgi:L,D-transpeptidase ErfK/SrfK
MNILQQPRPWVVCLSLMCLASISLCPETGLAAEPKSPQPQPPPLILIDEELAPEPANRSGLISAEFTVDEDFLANEIEFETVSSQESTGLQAEITKAREFEKAGDRLGALKHLSQVYWAQNGWRDELLPELNRLAKPVFFDAGDHAIEPYTVESGDILSKVANRYRLSWQYLAKLNRVDPKRIRAGQKLKVVRGPFSAAINLSEFRLTIHLQGYFVKSYLVGIGKDGQGPMGALAVLDKVENPQYTDPNGKVIAGDDPANPLGERWLDLGDGYGIHGTTEPNSIGQAASRGCIRMRDADIIEVYDFLVPGSEVVIKP